MGRTFSVRLNREEAEMLEQLKRKLGLRHDAEAIRVAIKRAYEHYFGEERPKE